MRRFLRDNSFLCSIKAWCHCCLANFDLGMLFFLNISNGKIVNFPVLIDEVFHPTNNLLVCLKTSGHVITHRLYILFPLT